MRINITIPDKMLKRVDEHVKKREFASRSAFIQSLLMDEVGIPGVVEGHGEKELKSFEGFSKLDPKTETFISPKRKKFKVSDELVDKWNFKSCKHGINPKMCKDRKCRRT